MIVQRPQDRRDQRAYVQRNALGPANFTGPSYFFAGLRDRRINFITTTKPTMP
jgi:hypothetical protein